MTQATFRLGPYRIDPRARELWRGEQLVPLPPHVFDCLAYLVEHRDRAVGRDELVAAVWGRTEVSDTLLGQTLLRVRRELGDDGKGQRVVRTIPRFGYRWVAALTGDVPANEAADAAMPVSAAPDSALGATARGVLPLAVDSRRRTRRRWALVLALAAASSLGLLAWFRFGAPPATRSASAPAVAASSAGVFPAEVDAGTEWEWLRFGLMDAVATRLRSAGLPTVPSENIIVLLSTPPSQRRGSARETAGFAWLVTPRASRGADGWRVQLDADDAAGRHHNVEATAPDAIDAAGIAATRLLAALGRNSALPESEATPEAELVRRVDAAILADDPATARALIGQSSASARRSPELRLRLAHLDFRSGHLQAARDRLLALLDEAPPQTAPVLRGQVLNGLGAVTIRNDEPQQAERFFAEAVELLAPRAEPAQLGEAYLGRAAAAADQRHFDAAAADYARARIALKQANDTLALVRVAADEGFLDLDQGRPAQALPELAAASAGFLQWGALNEAIFTHVGQIGCELALLEPAKAMDVADAAAPLAVRIDNQDTRDSLAIARGKALAAVGRLREARDVLSRVRAAHPALHDSTAAVAAVPLAQMALDEGDSDGAAALAAGSVDTLVQPAYARARADAWLIRLRALAQRADPARTTELAALQAWADATGDAGAAVRAQLARAESSAGSVAAGAWRAEFDKAGALAERRAVPAEIAMVASAHAEALIADGDLPAAAVEVGRLSRWSETDFRCAVLEARLYSRLGRDGARRAALAHARALAGERTIAEDATLVPIAAREPSAH